MIAIKGRDWRMYIHRRTSISFIRRRRSAPTPSSLSLSTPRLRLSVCGDDVPSRKKRILIAGVSLVGVGGPDCVSEDLVGVLHLVEQELLVRVKPKSKST